MHDWVMSARCPVCGAAATKVVAGGHFQCEAPVAAATGAPPSGAFGPTTVITSCGWRFLPTELTPEATSALESAAQREREARAAAERQQRAEQDAMALLPEVSRLFSSTDNGSRLVLSLQRPLRRQEWDRSGSPRTRSGQRRLRRPDHSAAGCLTRPYRGCGRAGVPESSQNATRTAGGCLVTSTSRIRMRLVVATDPARIVNAGRRCYLATGGSRNWRLRQLRGPETSRAALRLTSGASSRTSWSLWTPHATPGPPRRSLTSLAISPAV